MPPPALEDIRAAYDFIRWADLRLLRAAQSIPDPTEYHKDRNISHGSLHALLLHTLAGQSHWLQTWATPTPPTTNPIHLPDTSPTACRDLPSITKAWPQVHTAITTYLTHLNPSDLTTPVQFIRNNHTLTLPRRATITHLLDHCAYHRGQLNTLIKLSGGHPARLSHWIYALQNHPQPSGLTDTDFLT